MGEKDRRTAIAELVGSSQAEMVTADLEAFCALVLKWQPAQNLVSRETLGDLWHRHILDSLQLLPLFEETDRKIVDVGSGGGFPAIPLAIASKHLDRAFLLVESNARKASFLRSAARELNLNVRVAAVRTDAVDSRETQGVDVITARALAPLDKLLGLIAPFMGPQTRAILPKGREHVEELAQADALWHYDVLKLQSSTDSSGAILQITNSRRKIK